MVPRGLFFWSSGDRWSAMADGYPLIMVQFVAALASVLLSDPIPPNDPIPPELEHCVQAAGECVADLGFPICTEKWEMSDGACLEMWEDCSFPFPEAHEPNCRVSLAWCLVEWCISADEHKKWCVEVAEVCG